MLQDDPTIPPAWHDNYAHLRLPDYLQLETGSQLDTCSHSTSTIMP